MSCEEPVSPRRRGLILFNPKFSRQNNAQDQSESNSSSTFPKPRKYFDSADFFMREEMKNHDDASENPAKKTEAGGDKSVHHGSSLASECQTVTRTDSPDSVNKNVVPLILLRRSKSSAMINSADGTDEPPETLPTTVEVLNGPSSREIPSGESTPTSEPHDERVAALRGDSPSLDGNKSQSPLTQEEVRSLLIPRLNKTPAHEEPPLVVQTSSPKSLGSPLRTTDEDDEMPSENPSADK